MTRRLKHTTDYSFEESSNTADFLEENYVDTESFLKANCHLLFDKKGKSLLETDPGSYRGENESNEDRALRLYESISVDLRKQNTDVVSSHYKPEKDDFRCNVIETISVDETRRKNMVRVSTFVKEKFAPNYWRKWNSDLAILEEASRKELLVPPEPKPKPQLRSKLHKDTKGASFSVLSLSEVKEKNKQNVINDQLAVMNKQFVGFLLKDCLDKELPSKHPPKLNESSFQINSLKGAAFSRSEDRKKKPKDVTKIGPRVDREVFIYVIY